MVDIVQMIRRKSNILAKLLPFVSFVIPFFALYSLYPDSFEMTWKGRTYQLFFLWLFLLETILNWEETQAGKISELKSARTIAFVITLLIPTTYVVVANLYRLNHMIQNLAGQYNIPQANMMPLSTEYLVFALLFVLIILLAYGIKGFMGYSISMLFLGVIGAVYTIDNIYPQGSFTPFQILVPTTAILAANVLNIMGYQTEWTGEHLGTPVLEVWNSNGRAEFGIAWPCSGIESLLIYTVTILLFLKRDPAPLKQKIIYFAIGAVVTYFINVSRIAMIFMIAINDGPHAALRFHDYYGQLYSITWIISYPLIIIGSRALWGKIRDWELVPRTFPRHLDNSKIEVLPSQIHES
jgi:exosortase/archaeosortase family protein